MSIFIATSHAPPVLEPAEASFRGVALAGRGRCLRVTGGQRPTATRPCGVKGFRVTLCIFGYFDKVAISMFCGYEAVFGAFAKYSNEGSDRDSECNPTQNPLTPHGLGPGPGGSLDGGAPVLFDGRPGLYVDAFRPSCPHAPGTWISHLATRRRTRHATRWNAAAAGSKEGGAWPPATTNIP